NSASTPIQVDENPIVNITPVPDVCLGASPFNLSATVSVGSGTWSGTGITNATAGTFNAATAGLGIHTITYIATNGTCTANNTINIEVVPGINITISALGPTVFCQGNSVQLVVSGAGSQPVTWSNGQSGDTLTVTNSGNYFAVVSGSCTDTSNT